MELKAKNIAIYDKHFYDWNAQSATRSCGTRLRAGLQHAPTYSRSRRWMWPR